MSITSFWTIFYAIFLTSIAVGPVFITITNISITYGIKNGIFSVIGVAFGNILYMTIGALTAQQLISAIPDTAMMIISFVATLFLISMAIGFWKKDISKINNLQVFQPSIKTIIKMFIITLSSPVVITGYSITFLTFSNVVRQSFFSSLIGGISGAIVAYSLVAIVFGLLGGRIKKISKEKYLKFLIILNKIVAVLLLLFASFTLFNFVRTILRIIINS